MQKRSAPPESGGKANHLGKEITPTSVRLLAEVKDIEKLRK